jgi:dTDP-4-amino-4,6-dideoxygalactose transaminase
MDPILDYAKQHNLKVIEDCAQAHGAFYKEKPIGSFGDAAAFSFCQDKIMTTAGEGGLLALKDFELWKKAWSYKDHGKNCELISQSVSSPGFKWIHDSFGTNWRMTEIQAAIGRVQLRKLSDWVKIRRRNASFLTSCCERFQAFRVTKPNKDFFHSYYKYYMFINTEALKHDWDRDKIMRAIQKEGVPCFTGSCPEIYLEKAFIDAGFAPKERFGVAKELGETSLMFLVHPTLTDENMQIMCKVIEKVMSQASR